MSLPSSPGAAGLAVNTVFYLPRVVLIREPFTWLGGRDISGDFGAWGFSTACFSLRGTAETARVSEADIGNRKLQLGRTNTAAAPLSSLSPLSSPQLSAPLFSASSLCLCERVGARLVFRARRQLAFKPITQWSAVSHRMLMFLKTHAAHLVNFLISGG